MLSELDSNKRTGILGGTFDPIHLGHINIVKNICRKKLIEQAIFIPTGRSPHKNSSEITPINHRMNMLSIALEKFNNFYISDFEAKRKSVSFTIDTMRFFRRKFGLNMFILIGVDSLCELKTWHKALDLVSQFNFIVYRRPGFSLPSEAELGTFFGESNSNKLFDSVLEKGTTTDISASKIRHFIGEKKDVSRYLGKDVLAYIERNNLYRD